MSHEVTGRAPRSREGEDVWDGVIACSCGWVGEVHGYPSWESAQIGMQAAWIWHADEWGSDVAESGPE